MTPPARCHDTPAAWMPLRAATAQQVTFSTNKLPREQRESHTKVSPSRTTAKSRSSRQCSPKTQPITLSSSSSSSSSSTSSLWDQTTQASRMIMMPERPIAAHLEPRLRALRSTPRPNHPATNPTLSSHLSGKLITHTLPRFLSEVCCCSCFWSFSAPCKGTSEIQFVCEFVCECERV